MSTTGNHLGRYWFKSSYSRDTSSCVEVSLGWLKSSYSRDTSSCVEVRLDTDAVLIRDDKYTGDPAEQPTIAVPARLWNDFLALVADEDAADGTNLGIPAIIRETDGTTTLRDSHDQVLVFTPGEWWAFMLGVKAGEFTHAAA
jgi:hypothetical protein